MKTTETEGAAKTTTAFFRIDTLLWDNFKLLCGQQDMTASQALKDYIKQCLRQDDLTIVKPELDITARQELDTFREELNGYARQELDTFREELDTTTREELDIFRKELEIVRQELDTTTTRQELNKPSSPLDGYVRQELDKFREELDNSNKQLRSVRHLLDPLSDNLSGLSCVIPLAKLNDNGTIRDSVVIWK